MLVILKIPIVYLCVVVWWAIKASLASGSPGAGRRVRHSASGWLLATAACRPASTHPPAYTWRLIPRFPNEAGRAHDHRRGA